MNRRILLCALLLGIALLAPGQGAAQDNATGVDAGAEYTLDAITVEAQKREQDIQDVPVSVNALSDVKLEEGRIYDFKRLDLAVPNLSFRNYGSRTNFSLLSIRGFAASDQSQDPTVGVYFDDIPITDFVTLSSPALFNMERIEVLRGPQSTLWGLNTASGAVLLYSKDPTDEWSGSFKVEGSGPETVQGHMAMSGPIYENTLGFSMAITGEFTEGHIDNIALDNQRPNEELAVGGRGKLVWTPTDDLELKFSLFADHIGGDAGFVLLPLDRAAYNTRYSERQGLDKFEVAYNDPGYSSRDSNTQSLKGTYETGWFDIVSITSRRDVAVNYGLDADNGPVPFDYSPLFGLPDGFFVSSAVGFTKVELLEFSQELRLVSPEYDDLPLQWILGAFYLNKKNYTEAVAAYPDVFSTVKFSDATVYGQNLAFFGQATYRLFDERLGLTAGLRYETVERKIDKYDDVLTVTRTVDDDIWLPRFMVDFKFTDDVMLYGSAARGWRNKGLNVNSPAEQNLVYQTETAWTYEAGLKTRFWDDKLQFNAAAFYTDISDYQATIQGGAVTNFANYLGNAESVDIYGLEAELKARPIEGLDLDLGFGWLDASYRRYQFSETVDYDGNRVADVPEWELSTAAQYTFPFGLYMRGEFNYIGPTFFDAANTARQRPYEVVNARVGYQKDAVDGYVFGDNLTDRQYFLDSYVYQDGLSYGPVGKGLSVGAGVSYSF